MPAELTVIQEAAAGRWHGGGIASEDLAHSCLLVESPCGVLRVGGADRLDLLHRLSTNALAGSKPGAARPTVFVTEKGRIIDLAHVLVREDTLTLVTSAGMVPTVAGWIEKFTIMEEVTVADLSGEFRLFLMSGLEVPALLSRFGPLPAKEAWSEVPGESAWSWSTPHDGVIAVLAGARSALPAKLADQGAHRLPPEALEGFRILHGIPGIGRELAALYNPLEAGARGAVSFTKGCYIGQEVIARLDTYDKVQRRPERLLLRSLPEGLPARILLGTEEAGVLTSAARVGEIVIGLALIGRDVPGDATLVVSHGVPDGVIPARVVPGSDLRRMIGGRA